MHDPGNNNCPRNADPRNESCACDMPLTYPNIQKACELMDVTVQSNFREAILLGRTTFENVYSLGSKGEAAAGLQPFTVTPWLDSIDELEAFCGRHMSKIEAIKDGEPLPYLEDC